MKPVQIVTKQSLKKLIDESNDTKLHHVIGRAIMVLYNNQTPIEQSTLSTRMDNSMGFAHCDARVGTLSAQAYISKQSLDPWMLRHWTKITSNGFPRICKYTRQLNDAAIRKAKLWNSISK